MSQAVFDPNAQSHIVSIPSNSTTSTGGPAAIPSSSNGPIVKTTTPNSSSHGIGIGAIAGIAIAIVLIASLFSGFFVYKCLKRRKDKKNVKFEIQPPESKVLPEEDDDSKKDFKEADETKKPVVVTATVNEVPGVMTPPPPSEIGGSYFFTGNEKGPIQSQTIELAGSPPNRSELSTPEPTHELDPEAIRSELSTPDPVYNFIELPSPNPSDELGSPSLSSVSSGQPSPPLRDHRQSALQSPAYLQFQQRPLSDRMDSSESEAGWTRVGMPRRPFHRRYQSDESLNPSLQSRPLSSRMESSDSEQFARPDPVDESSESEPIVSPVAARRNLTHFDSSDSEVAISSQSSSSELPRPRPAAIRMDSNSESDGPSPQPTPPSSTSNRQIRGLSTTFHASSSSRPAIRRSIHAVTRPFTSRTDSTDSEAWQTRLDSASTESPSGTSRFPSLRHSRVAPNDIIEARDESVSEESP